MKSMLATLAGDMLIRVETGYVPVLPAVAGDGGVYVPTRPGGLAVRLLDSLQPRSRFASSVPRD